MTTRLERELKREIVVKHEAYTVTLSPQGLKLTRKGKRKGLELAWVDLISGETALAMALNASVAQIQ